MFGALLAISLSMLIAQLLVKDKKTIHVVFAIFCGSMAMVAAKQIGSETFGAYGYLIGFGTCATCNGFWLVSRALFRQQSPIAARHILLAVTIGILIMINQGIMFADAISPNSIVGLYSFKTSLSEITNLLSSSVLTMTFWEAAREFKKVSGPQKWQRLLFMASFGTAVFSTAVIARGLFSEAMLEVIFPWFVVCAALQILITTQIIIVWQQRHAVSIKVAKTTPANTSNSNVENIIENDPELINGINQVLHQQQLYLQANLKMLDIAQRLNVPEYRISRVLRHHFNARNFNQFINSLRVQHAKKLLTSSSSQHWTVLVIGLESGFASIGPFNRAFKSECGCTPNEYRLQFNSQQILLNDQA